MVRQTIHPDHAIRFTGTTIWRTLLPVSRLDEISSESLLGLPKNFFDCTSWWHAPHGHFYLSKVGEGFWEIAARAVDDPAKVTAEKFSWGVPVTNERVLSHFTVGLGLRQNT